MSPIEVMARAIGNATDCDFNPLDGYFDIKELREFATAALLALSQMEPTPVMVEAVAGVLCTRKGDCTCSIGNCLSSSALSDARKCVSAMLAAAVKEGE